MDSSIAATGMWQPVISGLFQALEILVVATGVLYAAVLALGALGDRRATRAQLVRLHRVTAGARQDHQHLAARFAQLVDTSGAHGAGEQGEPVDGRPAQRFLEQLGQANDTHNTVAALMGGDGDPDLTHHGEEIDEAVARYREAVDRLATTLSTWSVGVPAIDGPGGLTGRSDDGPDRVPVVGLRSGQ